MDSLSYKTKFLNSKTAEREWLLVDAADLELGRLASRIAYLLRGKHHPGYTPHVDCGARVVVINAAKVKVSGKKWTDKVYLTHTGYPGGQREHTPARLSEKNPSRIIEWAVKGMLPKNRLGRKLFGNLYVYKDEVHQQEPQKPTPYIVLTPKNKA